MTTPEMFGGPLHNFGEPQNVVAARTQNALAHREGSPESPALDLKCYTNNNNNNNIATATTTSSSTSVGGPSNYVVNTNSNSPPTVVDSPSPTCDQPRPATPTCEQPENLSTTSDKQDQPQQLTSSAGGGGGGLGGGGGQPPLVNRNNNNNNTSREDMDTGRNTPMPASSSSAAATMRDYMQHSQQQQQHPEPSLHPHSSPSLLGGPSSSLYQPFPPVVGAGGVGIRPGSFYPIEHYFPHPVNTPAAVNETRHAPLQPPPMAKTPPR